MTDIDLARQLVAYVDATTAPVSPALDRPAEVVVLQPASEPPSRRWVLIAAAVAVVVLVGASIVAGVRDDGAIQELDDDRVPTSTLAPRLAVAVETAERYFEAWSTNDDSTVLGLHDTDVVAADPERNLIRWWFATGWSAGERSAWPSGSCRTVAAAGASPADVVVECPLRIGDPVARALGLDELTWAATVRPDGVVVRAPRPVADDGRDVGDVWQAYPDYHTAFRPDVAECDPLARDDGSVYVERGLPLDGLCARAVVGVADEVALWVVLGDDAPPLGLEALAGIWENTGGFKALVVEFGGDGTFSIGNTGRPGEQAFTHGTFEVDGDEVLFAVDAESLNCTGQSWAWRVAIPFDGLLEVDVVGAGGCAEPTHWQWTRLVPSSPAGTAIDADDGPAASGVEPAALFSGIWHRVGGGEILVVEPGGAYAVVRSGTTADPVDRGTVTVDRPGAWTFVSEGGGECGAGERWVWTDVTVAVGAFERGNPFDVVLRSPATPLCGSENTTALWRRVAPGTG